MGILTQADVDRIFEGLLLDGYPYMGPPNVNRHILEPDGRIRSVWANDDGEFVPSEDDVIQELEEIWESVQSWHYDY